VSPDLLDRLLAPPAVTVVGASPNGHVTHHLLRNLGSRSCRFAGSIHLVNPNQSRVFDRPCLPAPDRVPGEPGLVYLLVRPDACLPALEALPARPHGVVLFPDASRELGGYEAAIAAWGRARGVAVLGPQSNGLVSTAGRVHGLLVPVVEELAAGPVAVLAQSGGVLGGVVKHLAQRGVGLHSALEYGTACMLGLEELGAWLLARPEVGMLAVCADGVDRLEGLAGVLRATDKPVVLQVAGGSEAGRRAVASHSGMAATPRRLLEGVAAQFGALLCPTLDELVWSVEALHAVGFERPSGPLVAVFSDSGGGGIALADALARQGVPLVDPAPDLHNPIDFGSASMGHFARQADVVRAVGADPRFGVLAFASTLGLPVREQSVHMPQVDEFTATVASLGRVPVIASPLPFLPLPERLQGGAVLGLGSAESAAKIGALAAWARSAPRAAARTPRPAVAPVPRPAVVPGPAITGEAAERLLAGLPLAWPRTATVHSPGDLAAALAVPRPVVVKTEAGLAHRAREGGVLAGVTSEADLRAAVAHLFGRFRGPVSVSESVAHDAELFLGAVREAGSLFLLAGAGGAEAERANARLAPLDDRQARDLAEAVAPALADAFLALLLSFQDWLLAAPWVSAVDLNPIVERAGRLVALDAKIHAAAD
jgi:hypothetical protein